MHISDSISARLDLFVFAGGHFGFRLSHMVEQLLLERSGQRRSSSSQKLPRLSNPNGVRDHDLGTVGPARQNYAVPTSSKVEAAHAIPST